MKAKMWTGETINGYYGPKVEGGRWLFVHSKRSGRTYPIALVKDGQIVELDDERALRNFSNQDVALALIAAE